MRLLALICALLLITAPASAQYFVADTGLDTNNCLSPADQGGGVGPCATLQHAADLVPGGKSASITLKCYKPAGQECGFSAASAGAPALNVYHHRFVGVYGDCSVVGFARTKIVAHPGQVGFWVQDHATLTGQCIAFESSGSGSIAWAARQYTISDCAFCTFRAHPGGYMIALNETGNRFSCLQACYVTGGAAVFAHVDHASLLSLNAALVFDAVAFSSVFSGIDGKIDISGATITNGGVTGTQCNLVNTILTKGGVAVPGNPGSCSADGSSIVR